MNVLNKGRCSRCPMSEIKFVTSEKDNKVKKWRFCTVKGKWCKGCSSHCVASPMGLKIVEIN